MKPVSPLRLVPGCHSASALLRAFSLFSLLVPLSTSAQDAPQPESPKTFTLSLPAVSKRQSLAAANAFLEGVHNLDRNNLAAAETQFTKAITLNPRNPDYAQALAVTREHRITELVQQAGKARLLGHPEAADTLLAEALKLDPQNAIVSQHFDPGPLSAEFKPAIGSFVEEAQGTSARPQAYEGTIVLAPTDRQQSFHLRSDIQQVFGQVTSAYGIRAVFDSSVAQRFVHLDVDNINYAQAMPILLQMGHLFAVPLDAHSVFVAKDSVENRQRLERQLQETIYVPALSVEQMSELGNVARNIFDLKQVTVQNNLGTMVVRAPESILNAMNFTLADLIDGGSQVMLDLKLYSVDKTRTSNIGAQLPQQIGVYNVASAAHNLVAANQTLVDQAIARGLIPAGSSDITIALALIAGGFVQSALLSNTIGFFGGGITRTGITSNATPTFTLSLNTSDTSILDVIQLRIGDRQTSTFRVGTRYPITTSTYSFGSASGTASALAGITVNGVSAASLLSQFLGTGSTGTIPQISFEDLGITLKATPIVQKTNNVTVHIDLKIQALTGASLNNIPVLASRQFISDITIADGQTALLVSGLSRIESGAVSGIPGISELPGFQTATADKNSERDSSDLVLLITPHIVRRRAGIISGPRIVLNLPPTTD